MNIKDCKWNVKTANGQKLMTAEILKNTPKFYETEGIKLEDKIITAHYFVGNFDAYLIELDPATGEAFGYIGFNRDFELGYFSIPELAESRMNGFFSVEREIRWEPVKVSEVL